MTIAFCVLWLLGGVGLCAEGWAGSNRARNGPTFVALTALWPFIVLAGVIRGVIGGIGDLIKKALG